MNILLISPGNYDYDGRLRELMCTFDSLGELSAFTLGSVPCNARHHIYQMSKHVDIEKFPAKKKIIVKNSRLLWRWYRTLEYLVFIKEAVAFAKQQKNVDMLVLDNQKAVIPGILVDKLIHPGLILQDCRECYLKEEVPGFLAKMLCKLEGIGIKRADILVAANLERAEFMKEYYHLRDIPLIFENLRQLAYSHQCDEKALRQTYASCIHEDEIRIIATAGCEISRMNDVLVRNLDQVKYKCRLLLVGSSTLENQAVIEKIIEEKHLENVNILGRVNQDALKYLIQSSHIGIVSYHQRDLNNRFCASGKLFEFIYEGIPVVTTTNPPLSRLCEEGIGVADDSFADGINRVIEDYADYQEKAVTYARFHSVEQNRADLLVQIRNRISQTQ